MLATFSADDVFRHKNAKHDLNQTIKPMPVSCNHYEQNGRLRWNQTSAEGLLFMHTVHCTDLQEQSCSGHFF